MKRLLIALAALAFAASAAWVWALRQGPGLLELPPLAPWPKALAAAPEPAEGTTLIGSLRHKDGTAATDALIQVTLPTGVRWAYTDDSGDFVLTRIPAAAKERAELEFIVLILEYMPAIFTIDGNPGERILWTLGDPIPELEALPKLRFADFEGRVDRGELNAEGFEVWLVPPPGLDPLAGQIERRATVSADGRYQVPSLTTGIYQARLLPSWARGGTWPVLGTGALSFDPDSSQPTPRLTTHEGRILGSVSGANSKPLLGALLLVAPIDEPGHLWPPVQSDPAGLLLVDDLPPGGYRLELISGTTRLEQEVHVVAGETTKAHFDIVAH